MPTRNPFLRLAGSRKFWVALGGVAGSVGTVLCADPAKWTPVITSIVTLAGIVIAAMGYEDGQAKGADTYPGPVSVTQVGRAEPAPPDGGPPPSPDAWLLLLVLPAALLAGGCQGLESPAAAYVAADRSTYTAIAPEYATYVAADPGLSNEQKARRGRTVRTWALRIVKTEQGETTASAAAAPAGPPPSLYQPLPPPPAPAGGVPSVEPAPPVVPPSAFVVAPPADPPPPDPPPAIEMRPVEVPLRLR